MRERHEGTRKRGKKGGEKGNVTNKVVTFIVFILLVISHSLTVRWEPHSQFKSDIRTEVRARLLVDDVRVSFCGTGVEEGRWRFWGPILVVLTGWVCGGGESESLSDDTSVVTWIVPAF